MTQISNDIEFRNAIDSLDFARQRVFAGKLVMHVLDLCDDERIKRVAETAANPGASSEELATALKSAREATLACHARCGSEGDWKAQAGYFVARAATAAVTPEAQQSKGGGPAWQAAMSSRMARTSMLIDEETTATSHESEQQYQILSDYLNS